MARQHIFILIALLSQASGFVPLVPSRTIRAIATSNICTSLNLSASALPDVADMKAADLRKELQAYGISTKSFFEKSELVNAVKKARAEGKAPANNGSEDGSTGTSESASSSSSSKPRSELLAEEMAKCNSMKVLDLKKELDSYGVSTKSFFEKTEFVRAVAEARVDGVKKTGGAGATGSGTREEAYDSSYRDVVMQKLGGDPRAIFGGQSIIDVPLGR